MNTIGGLLSKLTVLIVEDEGVIAKDMSNQLGAMGYEPMGPAFTGEQAVQIAMDSRPDIVLMDISLAGDMDGIEAATLIKQHYNIPVIYLTAFSDDAILNRAKDTTPHGYLVKPFRHSELKASIEMAMFKHQMEEDLRLSRQQYKALLNASGAVPWEMDFETMEFTYVGEQAEKVLGLTPAMLDKFSTLSNMIHPHDIDNVLEAYKSVPDSGESIEVDYRVTLKLGATLWIRDSISSAMAGKGKKMLRGYMLDITLRKEAAIERERYIKELKEALDKIQTLHGLLPICAWCKKVRNDKGYWQLVEVYVQENFKAEFTHGICPDCKEGIEKESGIKDKDKDQAK